MMTSIHKSPLLPGAGGRYYASNNPFQITGPKGFLERIALPGGNLYFRVDLPGLGGENMRFVPDRSAKAITIRTEGVYNPNIHTNLRGYEAYLPLECQCCRICYVSPEEGGSVDGVARFTLGMDLERPVSPHRYRGGDPRHSELNDTWPDDPWLTRSTLETHPYGETPGPYHEAYQFKELRDGSGGVYVRMDMPGVPVGGFHVHVDVATRRVTVAGDAPPISRDSGGRSYFGVAVELQTQDGSDPAVRVERSPSHGVMHLMIYPEA